MPSTTPRTTWPLSRSAARTARSRLTRRPSRRRPRVVFLYVSGITSNRTVRLTMAVTARSTPSTAMLSPGFVWRSTFSARTLSSPARTRTTSPTSSMIPVNMRFILRSAIHQRILGQELHGGGATWTLAARGPPRGGKARSRSVSIPRKQTPRALDVPFDDRLMQAERLGRYAADPKLHASDLDLNQSCVSAVQIRVIRVLPTQADLGRALTQ